MTVMIMMTFHHTLHHQSSDSDREDSVLDEDIIELEHIFDQQRGRHRVQVKSEPDTKDIGDQDAHQTSLDTLESMGTSLSMEGTEKQSTFPSSEETLEAGIPQQSEGGEDLQRADEAISLTVMVKRNPRPQVAKPERQLYEPPALWDRSKTQSPTAEVAKKPSEQIGQSTPEGKTEQLRFFTPPAL